MSYEIHEFFISKLRLASSSYQPALTKRISVKLEG